MTQWRAALLGACLGLPLAAQEQAPAADAEVSCRVCHPGAVRGLAASSHAVLSQRVELAGKVCSSCHGDLSGHARALGQLLPQKPAVPKVAAASCKACHPGQDLEPARAAHPLLLAGSGAPPRPAPEAERMQQLEQREQDPVMAWSGFVELGYRFVHHRGSRDAYRTDVDLDPGAVLRTFEVRGTGSEAATFDTALVRGADLGDPRWDAELTLRKSDDFDLDSHYQRARYSYRASGDYHRVDRDSRTSTTTASVGIGGTWQLFGSLTSRDEDGYWLTQRIGNRNLPVQTVVEGVSSPRTLQSHEAELGLRGEDCGWHWLLAGGWYDADAVDRWSYSQPATANPAFTESENLRSANRLSGPTGRAELERTFGDVELALSGQVRDLHRELDADGTGSGFDVAEFTTTTTATGTGRSQLWIGRAGAVWTLSDEVRLRADAGWRDYEEVTHLRQTDVRTTPSLGTVTTVDTIVDDTTVQRLFEGEARCEWSPDADFDVSVGYGFAREQLRVPSLVPADPLDFRRGSARDDGLLAGLRWRFHEQWTVRADGRAFVQDGVPLHEIAPERAREAGGSVEWKRDPGHATAWVRHRHNENDVSAHRLDSFATGLHGGVTKDALALNAAYTFAQTESRTLTNFYFDPDPTPQQTLVGFEGDTHTWTLSLVGTTCSRLRAEISAAVTRTTGSFDVSTVDLRADLSWRWTDTGATGIEWRHMSYEENGPDDWAAELLFVYWRQEW